MELGAVTTYDDDWILRHGTEPVPAQPPRSQSAFLDLAHPDQGARVREIRGRVVLILESGNADDEHERCGVAGIGLLHRDGASRLRALAGQVRYLVVVRRQAPSSTKCGRRRGTTTGAGPWRRIATVPATANDIQGNHEHRPLSAWSRPSPMKSSPDRATRQGRVPCLHVGTRRHLRDESGNASSCAGMR